MKAHHASGVGYLETVEDGDRIKRPGANETIIVRNPRPVANGITFNATLYKRSSPGVLTFTAHWHRHQLIMPA